MKKLINKFKKIFLMVGIFCSSIYAKVLALEPVIQQQVLYGPPIEEPSVSKIPMLWIVARVLIIPLAFIIGVIIYLKKSSSSTVRKILTILIALLIVVLVCFGINFIMTNNL